MKRGSTKVLAPRPPWVPGQTKTEGLKEAPKYVRPEDPKQKGTAFELLTPSETDTQTNAKALEFLRAKHKELLSHLECKYANDRRTHLLRLNLTTIRLLPEYVSRTAGVRSAGGNTLGYRVASFTFETGVLEIAIRDKEGDMRPRNKVLMSYLHEAGHCLDSFMARSDDHGNDWKDHTMWLTNIATKELKWDVLLSCYYCNNYGVCTLPQCPACKWECPPPVRKGPRTIPKNRLSPFTEYSAPVYTRVCVQQDLPHDWWKQMCTAYEAANRLPRRPRTKTRPADFVPPCPANGAAAATAKARPSPPPPAKQPPGKRRAEIETPAAAAPVEPPAPTEQPPAPTEPVAQPDSDSELDDVSWRPDRM